MSFKADIDNLSQLDDDNIDHQLNREASITGGVGVGVGASNDFDVGLGTQVSRSQQELWKNFGDELRFVG
jgi:hypothetical protein